MKKALFIVSSVFLISLTGIYIWCLFPLWKDIQVWRSIISIFCHLTSVIVVIILLFSLFFENLSNLLYGFKFELLQLAFVSDLLAFVLIMVKIH